MKHNHRKVVCQIRYGNKGVRFSAFTYPKCDPLSNPTENIDVPQHKSITRTWFFVQESAYRTSFGRCLNID